MKTYRIAVGGLPFFGQMLAALLSGDGWDVRYIASAAPRNLPEAMRRIAAADLIYLIGGQIERGSRPDWLLRLYRGPVVMHWTGSDVTFAGSVTAKKRDSRRLIIKPRHWAEVPWIADELGTLGVTASVVPLTSGSVLETPPPLPEQFTVLSYLPPHQAAFYGERAVMECASALPDVPFLIAGSDGSGQVVPSNVEFLGWRADMTDVYRRATVLLRQASHDGLSFMALEAMSAGRHVIWNHPLPGVIEADSAGDALRALRRLLSAKQTGTLGLNEAGLASVRTQYAPGDVRSQLRERFAHLIAGRQD